ncbi:multidrug effflux MFS transporter [Parvularcula lutaonensis]|uniref:Bcr/CflA family efflux transporter n=1 Tax=Parvularcula lutaonensis TaxID=491923 RepID=A0ABV7MD94_9PROT|nr:multidrug effflux MFS transporter [Parvularcula lutaonensis]GGY52656.1 Bcr/CflA family drug resistance efflux transporter [Parvularcula lutaonensis]
MSSVTRAAPEAPNRNLIAGRVGRAEFIVVIAALMALNAFAIDIVLPAYPELAQAFSVTDETDVAMILVTYILGFSVGQLAFGPIADRYGRRAPLFVGMVLYALAAIGVLMTADFTAVLLLRALQGVGAAATRVIALAVVRDTMKGREMASLMSLVMMVFMVVPIFAPMAGEGLLIVSGWPGIFWAMALSAIALLAWCAVRLPETLKPEYRRDLSARTIVNGFGAILRIRLVAGYCAATAFFFSALFAFLTVAQPLYVGVYGLDRTFTIAFGAVAALMAVTSMVNSRLVHKLGARRLSHGALIAFTALSGVLTLLSFGGNPPFWLFMTLMALLFPLLGLIGANLNAIAMEPLGEVAGSASAILGFLQSAVAGLIGAFIGSLFDDQVVVLAAGFTIVSGLSVLSIWWAEEGKLFRAPNAGEA